MHAAIPKIEVTDHADALSVRRPDREVDTAHSADRAQLRAELLVDLEMIALGEEVQATVRPEKVRFGGEGDNTMTVKIHQVVYLGVSTQYIAELSGGEKLVLYRQNFSEEDNPEIGDEAQVAWDARNCLILGD